MKSHYDLPPSYEESEREAREAAAIAMLEGYTDVSPPPYEYEGQYQRLNNSIGCQSIDTKAYPSAPAPTPEDLQSWYLADLQEAQRHELHRQYQAALLNQQQFDAIRARTTNVILLQRLDARRAACQANHCMTIDDFLLMQLMIRDLPLLIELQWRLNVFLLETIIRCGRYVMPHIIDISANLMKMVANGSANSLAQTLHQATPQLPTGKDSEKAILAIAAVCILAIGAVASVVGGYYAVNKSIDSINHIAHGEKTFRSILRLTATGAGAAGGVYGGMILGSILGSVIPGFGTLAGSIVGGIIGGFLLAGVAALVAKHTMRLLTWLSYGSTNPAKFHVNPKQSQLLANKGATDTYQIDKMLASAKTNKPASNMFSYDPEKQELNADYNSLIRAIKTKPRVAIDGFYFTKTHLFRWSQNSNWQATKIPHPVPYDAPRYA